jgi:hypothetical protein
MQILLHNTDAAQCPPKMPPHCSSNQRLGDTTTSYMRLLILLLAPYQSILGKGAPVASVKISDLITWHEQWQRDHYFAAIRAGAVMNLVPMEEQFRQVLPGSTGDQ